MIASTPFTLIKYPFFHPWFLILLRSLMLEEGVKDILSFVPDIFIYFPSFMFGRRKRRVEFVIFLLFMVEGGKKGKGF